MHMQLPIMLPTQTLKREQIVLELLKRWIDYWKLKAKSLQNGKMRTILFANAYNYTVCKCTLERND